MSIRAKFVVVEKKEFTNDNYSLRLQPVIEGSEENKEFYKYTPGGEIQLQTINKSAYDQFKTGKAYYIDFTEAEEE